MTDQSTQMQFARAGAPLVVCSYGRFDAFWHARIEHHDLKFNHYTDTMIRFVWLCLFSLVVMTRGGEKGSSELDADQPPSSRALRWARLH